MVVRKHGWTQGEYVNQRGAVCILGALGERDFRCADSDVKDIVGMVVDAPLVHWNDTPMRKKAEVIAALDAAAVVALQEEGLEPEDVL